MTTNQSIEEKIGITDVKAQHAELYKEILDSTAELQSNPEKCHELTTKIEKLLTDMRDKSQQMEKSENYIDYNWLERAATEWQAIFSQILVEPKNIREEIKLPPRPSGVPSSRKRLDVPYSTDSYINTIANGIGENRKLSDLKRWIQELEQRRNRINMEIPSSPEEKEQDWSDATVYFSTRVLADRLDLISELNIKSSCSQLEKVFLDKVKRMNAYHEWQYRGEGWGLLAMEGDYRNACDELHQKLLNPNIKATASDFKDVREYLSDNYHIDNKSFLNSEKTKKLIQQKAYRIWQSKSFPAQSEKNDWEIAEKYVKCFYTNIIEAIEGQSKEKRKQSIENVLKALSKYGRKYDITNCLEAAIAIYFFDPKLCSGSKNDIF